MFSKFKLLLWGTENLDEPLNTTVGAPHEKIESTSSSTQTIGLESI